MIYKLGVSGASGRVGSEIAALVGDGFEWKRDRIELADAVTGSGKLSSIEGVAVRTFEDPPREPVHCWVDFSRPEGTMKLLAQSASPVVIGTTGFTDAQLRQIEKYAEDFPVLLAPNTSPGMNVMTRWLRSAPWAENSPFTVTTSEDHHRHKKDAPSGTAKRLLEVLKEAGYGDVECHVVRAGGIPGNHTVRFITDYEELELTHRVYNRRVFAEGALLAVLFLVKQKNPGIYRMEDVFSQEAKEHANH